VEVAERISSSDRLFGSLYNLGMVEFLLGRFTQALANQQRAYTIAVEEDNQFGIALAYSGLACAYHGLDERGEAQGYFDKALILYHKLGAFDLRFWGSFDHFI
jgi:tetratricopeptide (TPR) repeat protein